MGASSTSPSAAASSVSAADSLAGHGQLSLNAFRVLRYVVNDRVNRVRVDGDFQRVTSRASRRKARAMVHSHKSEKCLDGKPQTHAFRLERGINCTFMETLKPGDEFLKDVKAKLEYANSTAAWLCNTPRVYALHSSLTGCPQQNLHAGARPFKAFQAPLGAIVNSLTRRDVKRYYDRRDRPDRLRPSSNGLALSRISAESIVDGANQGNRADGREQEDRTYAEPPQPFQARHRSPQFPAGQILA